MPTFETLTWQETGHIVRVALNRPDKMNAFSLTMLDELSSAYTAYEKDDQLRCLILAAEGDHFTAGLDLAEVGPAVQAGRNLFADGKIDPLGLYDPVRCKPVICAVQGWCLTIGIELLLASDIRLAADDARFSQMEIKRGIMPFGGATLRLPQVAGWGNAMRYLLTADKFDAEVAENIGLIQEITTKENLDNQAMAIAETIAKQAPLAVQETLKSARLAVAEGQQVARDHLASVTKRLMQSKDAHEGLQSFIERREADFKGH